MVKTDDTKVQDDHRRKVLRDQDHKPLRLGSYMVGAAITVLGAAIVALVVAVASGFNPPGADDRATTVEWTLEQELAAIRGNRGMEPVARHTKEWTLEDELSAIRDHNRIAQSAPQTRQWTVEDELAAIRSHGDIQAEASSSQPSTQQSGPR